MRSEREEGEGRQGRCEGREGRRGKGAGEEVLRHLPSPSTTEKLESRAAGCACHLLQPPIPAVDGADPAILVEKVTTALPASSQAESLGLGTCSQSHVR